MELKCLDCVAQYKKFLADQILAKVREGFPPPEINDAVTLVPAWQQQVFGGQIVMACVAVPTCLDHIQVIEMSAEQKAVLGGRLLQGTVGQS